MKELAKVSENENPMSQDKKASHHEFETLFIEKLTSFKIASVNFSVEKEVNVKYSNLYFHQNAISVFHPPTV